MLDCARLDLGQALSDRRELSAGKAAAAISKTSGLAALSLREVGPPSVKAFDVVVVRIV
jgi:hypothetical protein